MAPTKQHSGHIDYMQRNLYDDFLDQFSKSTNDKNRGLVLMRGTALGEGLRYRTYNIADARVPMTGLELFRRWYGQRNAAHPFSNGWRYDMGKLVVPNVFLDVDLLLAVAARYDPVTRVIRDNDGEVLLNVNADVIQRVFDLSENGSLLVQIDLEEMKQEYAKIQPFFRSKLLPPHLVRAGSSTIHMSPTDQEPFRLNCFADHFLATFYSLCQILGFSPNTVMPIAYMFMGVQIQHPNFSVVYDYASFVAERMHEGLLNLLAGNTSVPFFWYSLLMHMFLYENVGFFSEKMELRQEVNGERLPVQAWSADMSYNKRDASYVQFDNCFASRLRARLMVNMPRILEDLHDFLRPKARRPELKVCHNWGDIIPYPVSTILRVYGFQGTPHILPYNVPSRMGFAEVLWQLGCIHEDNLTGKGKGTLFPDYTVVSDFVFSKGGWVHFDQFFINYHLKNGSVRQHDPEGFFALFRQRIKGGKFAHVFNFPEDLIRNEFDLGRQELNKEKWIAYEKLLALVHKLDPKYDPLMEFTPFHKRIDFLMSNFREIMSTLRTKKINLEVDLKIQGLEVRPVEERPICQPPIDRPLYRRKRDNSSDEEVGDRKGKQIMKASSQSGQGIRKPGGIKIVDLDSPPRDDPMEPPPEPSPKRQRIEEPQDTSVDEIIVTDQDMQVGTPSPPKSAQLVLTDIDIKGQNVQDARMLACKAFLDDDAFVKTPVFLQLVWRLKLQEYQDKCKERRETRPDRSDQENDDEVKTELIEQFKNLTPDEGRKIVSQAGVLLLPEWDIADAVAFNAIMQSKHPMQGSEEEVNAALQDSTFSEEYETLAIWALAPQGRKPNVADLSPNLRGGLIIKRVSETSTTEATSLTLNVAKLAQKIAERDEAEKKSLMEKYNTMIGEYSRIQKRNVELQSEVDRLRYGQLGESSGAAAARAIPTASGSLPPVVPIISIPGSPIQTAVDSPAPGPVKEEVELSTDPTKEQMINKVTELQAALRASEDNAMAKHNEVVDTVIRHLNEKIDSKLPVVHSLYSLFLEGIQNINRDKEVILPLIEKWIPRATDLDIMFKASKFDVNNRPQSLKPTQNFLKSLKGFQALPDDLSKKIRELIKNFDDWDDTVLPHIMDTSGNVQTLQQWQEKAEEVINEQIKLICDDSNHDLLVNSMDKIINTSMFLESFEREANQVAVKFTPYSTKMKEVMDFNWPTDDEYQSWVDKYLTEED